MSSQSLAQTLNTVWSGTTVTSIRDDDRLIDVVLRANDSERLNLATLSSLTVEGRDGQKFPLAR